MRKCPKCKLNYIKNDVDSLCSVCMDASYSNAGRKTDDNKSEMERNILPKLRSLSPRVVELFTNKKESFDIFKLRIPLLVRCRELGKDCCKKEVIVDNSRVYRYYIEPYNINGVKYHICSQWWNFGAEESKLILQLFKNIDV